MKPHEPLNADYVCLGPLFPHEGAFSAGKYEYDGGKCLLAHLVS